MRKTLKKGFTLTELIIVIVIIAILLAIFIPLLTTYTKKARIVTEKEIVRNLNLALSNDFDYVESGKKHENMHEALKAAAAAGYSVEKINNTKTGNEILWDSVNDVFCYLNGDVIEYIPNSVSQEKALHADDYRLWKISNTIDEYYSTYYTGDLTVINTSKGFDAGEKAGITAVNYRNEGAAQDFVVIRTNSANTTLIIDDASEGTIYHYGVAGALNIIQCHTASYHENGTVAFAEIAKGRIVLESGSKVEHIHLNTSEVNDETVFNNITVAKASDVQMPDFSRDPVEIPAEGKLVVALQEGTKQDDNKEYVWLTAVGIYEQVTVSTSDSNAGTTYATSDSVNAEKKETAQQIANNITFTSGNVDYKVTATPVVENNVVTGWIYEVIDQNGNVSEDYSATKDSTENTVNVQTTGDTPTTVETTKENGLDETAKDNLKDNLVTTAKAAEQTGDNLLGVKNVRLNSSDSIGVSLPINTSDGSLTLDNIASATLVPFYFKFPGGVSFVAPESINEEWNNATADFVISFDTKIDPISSFKYNYNGVENTVNGENVRILPVIPVGKFGNNATSFWEPYKNMWLPCPITSDGYTAGTEIALLEDVFASVGFSGVSVNCGELVNDIKEFSCGLVFLKDIGEVTITVKLVVTNNNEKHVVGIQKFTFDSKDYVTTCPSGTYSE